MTLADVVQEANRFLVFASRDSLADVTHNLGREFPGTALSPLPRHVRHVFQVGAKEQMLHTDAGRHIACVANLHAIRNRAVHEHPRGAMR